ncbi:uncharacterized protein LOC128559316 [Mercenaria mercenaria]|uniref:uncharacterized protein LOC128559316 n=1 Tax=Mercenaria mercenaria TaxID=6596 RepID=UPI00234EDD30|nr:uncharacterized protein LOC128559316 [Mercenaria mercenaria]
MAWCRNKPTKYPPKGKHVKTGASKNRKYSPSKMEAAVHMVESGSMSKKKAALTFGVPRAILIDKLSGRYKLGSTPGRSTVLTKAEEQNLVDYCKLMTSVGYPLKKDELLHEVKKVLDHDKRPTPFNNNLHGKDWFYGFKKRHPEISQRTAMTLGHQRAGINESMINGWFDSLQSFLHQEVTDWRNMVNDPRRCFSADESGFPLCVNTGKVLAEKGARHVYQVTSSTKQQLTVMVCFNAFGDYIPPLIIFPGECFRDCGIQGFPEAIYGQTSNGWMDSELFVEFLKHFNTFVIEKCIQKPVILYVDGHSTHMSLEAATYCHDNDIVLYCLFPNATHVLQPCDVGFFGPMKSAWKKEVKEWHLANMGQAFTKRYFPAVFKKAWLRVAKLENAIHGFQRCGLFPLCPNNVDLTKLNPSKLHEQRKTELSDSVETEAAPVTPSTTATFNLPAGSSLSVSPTPVSVAVTLASPEKESAPVTPDLPVTEEAPHVTPTEVVTSPVVSYLPASSASPPCQLTSSANVSFSTAAPAPTSGAPVTVVAPYASLEVPGPSGACTSRQGLNFVNDKESYVSPSFALLAVPEIAAKKKANNIRQKLPKALSGYVALNMLKEREIKKRTEEEAKKRRKEEREAKKKQRDEEKQRKKQEREEQKRLKKKRDLNKNKKSKKRKLDESSSDSDGDVPRYAETDDDYDEMSMCPGCLTNDGD